MTRSSAGTTPIAMTEAGRGVAASRRRAQRRGHMAEGLCALWLRLKGYRILERRFRVGVGEIDIVAMRGTALVFVEVKARPTLADAADAVGSRQRARIRRAAAVFLARHPHLASCDLRFDLMLVTPRGRPRHIVDAWSA